MYFLPVGWQGMLGWRTAEAARPAAARPVSSPAPMSAAVATPLPAVAPAPASSEAATAAAPAAAATSAAGGFIEEAGNHEPEADEPAAAGAGAVQVSTSAPSWVEVTDASGHALVARVVAAGETLALDGTAPFRVRVGNASATRLSYRGQPVTLAAGRDNVATVELK